MLLRGYGLAFLYTFPGLDLLGSVELPQPAAGRGDRGDAVRLGVRVSEGAGTPVWQVDLPSELVAAMAGGASGRELASGSASASAR